MTSTKLISGEHTASQRAFENALRTVNLDRQLPQQVFYGQHTYLFFESDRLFVPEFLDTAVQLLRLEGARVTCLLNLDKTAVMSFEEAAAVFLNDQVTGEMYKRVLEEGGPANGWLYRVDRYIAISDVGTWCIYCEKENDIAVIGLRDGCEAEAFDDPLRQLGARPIEELIEGGCAPLFPYDHLVPVWRRELVANYGDGDAKIKR